MRKSFVSPVPSCFMHEALRTGLVSNYSMCVCVCGGGGGLYGPRPQFLKWFKNVGYLDKSQAIINYLYQDF